uniref:ATPase AAA-type core domain-containing protein n=2 Tax=Aegilops tauschii subsp. strangulata TaxID=200361 RepID=A0A452XC41_AEGTS
VTTDFSGTPTFLSSSARAALSPPKTANAASSPTMPAVGVPTGAKASGAMAPSSTPPPLAHSLTLMRRPSSTTSWHSRRARNTTPRSARRGSVGTSITDRRHGQLRRLQSLRPRAVYDLELTTVKNNTELRKLFIETTGKSIIVIENIDCFVNLSGKHRKDKKTASDKDSNNDDKPKLLVEPENDDVTKEMLSGLLNFIDGLWSACGGERIIIFTTNHKEKLDSVLIRQGRVDKHIEMSYYRFEGFKVFTINYLDVLEHELFGEI